MGSPTIRQSLAKDLNAIIAVRNACDASSMTTRSYVGVPFSAIRFLSNA